MKQKKENFLDFIPVINPDYTWGDKNKKHVTVHMVNKGFFNRAAQIFFKRPKVSHIDLDEYGSFLWRNIDGKRTIEELAGLMKEQFGEKAEPLYDRLVKYMRILQNNKFINFNKKDKM